MHRRLQAKDEEMEDPAFTSFCEDSLHDMRQEQEMQVSGEADTCSDKDHAGMIAEVGLKQKVVEEEQFVFATYHLDHDAAKKTNAGPDSLASFSNRKSDFKKEDLALDRSGYKKYVVWRICFGTPFTSPKLPSGGSFSV